MAFSSPPAFLRPRAHRLALESRQLFDGAIFVEAATFEAAPPDAPVTDAGDHAIAETSPDAGHATPVPEGATGQVYVIDSRVGDWQALVDSLPADSHVVLLDAQHSGAMQIAGALEGRTGISGLHIFGHGGAGHMTLGSDRLDTAALEADSAAWQAIGASLGAEGDILLYGCDVSAQSEDLALALSVVTGADVASSTDPTGRSTLGGNWSLETSTGQIETLAVQALAFDGLMAAPVVRTTAVALQVSEPSSLNEPGADSATLSGWTLSDDGTGNVTVDAIVARPAAGPYTGLVIGTLSSAAGGTVIADGLRFTGSASDAQAWLNQLVFTANDRELGLTAAATTIQVTVTDSESPALSATHTLAVTVSPSNDPTTVNVAPSQSVNEIGTTVISAATLGFADPEVTAGTQTRGQIVYAVTAQPTHGYLTANGVRLGVGSVFTQAQLEAGAVVYHHTATGAAQNTPDGFAVRVSDGATPIDQAATSTVTLTITPLNQAPTVSGSGAVYEGQPANSAGAAVGNFIEATGGGDDADAALTVRLTSLPADGTLYFTGSATIGGVVQTVMNRAITAADIAAGFSFAYTARGGLTYANDGQRDNDPLTPYPYTTNFGVAVTDAGGQAGAAAALTAAATIDIVVRPVNDDPVLDPASTLQAPVTSDPGTVPGGYTGPHVVTLTPAMLGARDVDSGAERLSFRVTTQDLDHGVLLLNGQVIPAGGSFSLADIQAGRVQFVQTTTATPGETDTFQFQIVDNTTGPRWNADGTLIERVGGDYDNAGTPGVLGDDTLRTHTFSFQLTSIAPGVPPSFPTATPTVTFSDSAYAGHNGSSSLGDLLEGGSVALGGTGRPATEPGLSYVVSGIPPSQVIYTIEAYEGGGTNGNGSLQINNGGGWVNLDQYDTFTQADLDDGRIRFQHDGNVEDFESAVRLSVTAGILVRSNPADPNSPLVSDQWTPTFTFFVTPVNDAPVAVGSSDNVVAEGEAIFITAADLGIRDADDAVSEGRLEGAVQGGSGSTTLPEGGNNYAYNNDAGGPNSLGFLVYSLPAGGTLQYLSGGTWTDVIVSTAGSPGTRIDAALLASNGVRFQSDGTDGNPVTGFDVRAIDRWGAQSDLARVDIFITNVNDAPEIDRTPRVDDGNATSVNRPLTVTEGSFAQITAAMLRAYDVDSTLDQVQYTITSSPGKGRIAYSTDGGATFQILGAGSSFTQVDIDAGRIYYLHGGDESDGHTFANTAQAPTDRFTFSISDGDKEQRNNEFWIYVEPVNDPPVVTAPTGPINIDSANPVNNPLPGFIVDDPDLNPPPTITGEVDALQVTVRLLQADGTPFTLADYAGITLGATGTTSVVGGVLVINGTRAEVQAALDGLTVTFPDDRDRIYQVQVIADDRLRDAGGNVIGANGGQGNQPLEPGLAPALPLPLTNPNWYSYVVPAAGSGDPLLGNIGVAAVTVRASSVNDPAILTGPGAIDVYEDQFTRIGPGLALTVSDAESEAFNLPVTVTLTVPHGTLAFGATGTADTSLTPAGAGRQPVTLTGDGTGTVTLTGRASDIEALLRDSAQGLAYRAGTNINHDLNAGAAGDVTLTLTLDDAGSRIGGDTGAGSVAANPVPLEVALTIVPVNDAPTVSAGTGYVTLNGPTVVPGFAVADIDNSDGGALGGTFGEADFVQVTVRLTDGTGAALAAGVYGDNNIVIDSAATGTGVTVDTIFGGTNSALVIRGTVAQVNAYLASLRVSLDNNGTLANSDQMLRLEVIVDDRLRDAGGVLTGGANGGLNNNAAGGTQAVPGTAVDPYGAVPAGLTQNVGSAWRDVFPSAINDPADVTVAGNGITVPESNGSVTLTGIAITDSDALDSPIRVTVSVPPGFSITGNGGAGANGVISGDGQTLVLNGTQTQINAWVNAVTIGLQDPAGPAGIADYHGTFPVTIVVNDLGSHGSRPTVLTGDSNDPTSPNGDYSFEDGTTPNLITTRTFNVTVTPVNDAPLVVGTDAAVLPVVSEDVTAPAGATVETLFPTTRFSDALDDLDQNPATADNDQYFGIAINSLAVNAAQGAWQYSTDGGSTWQAVGNRSDANALVLDRDDMLRFVPATNFHGTPNGLTVRLVETNGNADTTSTSVAPVSGDTVDLTTTGGFGGTSQYSASTIALGTTVANVNDRPTGTSASIPAGTEDQSGAARSVAALFGPGYSDAIDDQDGIPGGADAATIFGGIAIVGNTADAATQGEWQYSLDGSTWLAVGAVSDGSARLLPPDAQLRFNPVAHFNGTPPGLTVRLSDVPVSAGAGVDISAAVVPQTSTWSQTVQLTTAVNPVNDAPVVGGTITNPAVTENGDIAANTGVSIAPVPLLSGVTLSDLDLGSTGALDDTVFGAGSITVTLTGGFAGSGDLLEVATLPGIASLSGGTGSDPLVITLAPTATVAQVQAILEAVRYSNSSDNPTNYGANPARGYSVVVNDGNNAQAGGNAGTGGALNSNALTGTITITPTNDAPVANDDVRTVTEGDGPIAGNVILGGQPGEVADTDLDNRVADLRVTEVRTGTEAGSGTTGSVGAALVGAYGTLVLNGDGSYTYTLNNDDPRVQALINGEVLNDVFTYRVDDGAGGTDLAQLSIRIDGSGANAPIVGARATVPVAEAGLVAEPGSPLYNTHIATSSFGVRAQDGLASLSIQGVAFTIAELRAATPASPLEVTTPAGVLRITGLSGLSLTTAPDGTELVVGATVEFSYTLSARQDHSAPANNTDRDEVLALVVTDRDGDAFNGDITIEIYDDAPLAQPDTGATTEDAAAPLTGNVRANDYQGADVLSPAAGVPVTGYSVDGTTNSTTSAGTAVVGLFGTVTINADGSYSYALDNSNPRVQALIAGETLTETVRYTLTDADGDTSVSTLTITIAGAANGSPGDDVPVLTVDDGNAGATGQLTVSEAGLGDAGNASEIASGTLSISAADGITSISIAGTPVTLAQLQAATPGSPVGPIVTDHGTITITGFTPGPTTTGPNGATLVTSGTVLYTYTLTDAQDHGAPGERTDAVSLSVTDRDGDVTTGTLTVLIIDDVPTAIADTNSISENQVSISGNVVTNDRLGADGAAAGGALTGLSFGATPPTVGTRFATGYGWLTLNADGSYTYELDNSNPTVNALKNGQTLTETVGYTITDGDGDTSVTTLTLTINGVTDGAPSVLPVDGNGAGVTGEATVSESGLVDATGSESTTGTLTLNAPDGFVSVTVGGTELDLAALQALGQGGANSTVTIDTGEGTLVLTGFTPVQGTPGIVTGGALVYTYTLKDPIVNAPGATESTDVIDLSVLDAGGITGTGQLTVQIVDDVPLAAADVAEVTEDGANPVTGNVRGNDYQGADVVDAATGVPVSGYSVDGTTNSTAVPGTAVAGQYGSITINADGSYSYTLDNGNPAVNALRDGETLTETVRYTLTDRDGDSSETTLTITIRGRTDGEPAIVPVDGNGAATGEATVNERGLADGSGSDGTTGSLTVTAPDGLASVTIGGTTITLAALQTLPPGGIVITTDEGVLTVIGFTPVLTNGIVTGGTIDYGYTLTQTQVNAPGATEATDSIALTVTQADANNTTSTGTLTVRIVDDVPEAVVDDATIAEDGAPTVSGNVKTNDVNGADDANGVPVTGVRFGGTTVPPGTTLLTQYGSIVVNADGSYVYTLDNSNPEVQHLIPGETLVDTIFYTITDNDGDSSTAQLLITIEGTTDPVTLQIVDGNGAGTGHLTVDERGLNDPANSSESGSGRIVIGAPDGVSYVVIGGVTVGIDQLRNLGGTPVAIVTDKGTLTLTGFDPVTGTLSYSYTLDRSQPHGAGEVTDNIAITVFDRDGDSASGTLGVVVLDDVPLARDDTATVSTARPDPTSVSGNVFGPGGAGRGDAADRLGADFTPTPVSGVSFDGRAGTIGEPLQGGYGRLQLNADGSYTYTVDTTNSRVASLGEGQTLTEVYTYTLTDADGSTSTATLTITLRGVSQHRHAAAGDEVWPTAFRSPTRYIAQGMAPAVFVQLAVAESREMSQRLMAGLATRAAGGADAMDGDAPQADLEGQGQPPAHAEHVGRDGVAFSRALVRDVQQTLAQRGLDPAGVAGGANSLFGDGAALRNGPANSSGAPAGERAANVPTAPAAANVPATPAAERIRVPRADATDWLPAADAALHADAIRVPAGATGATGAARADAAPSFSQRVAASAGERGSVRDMAREPVRIRIPVEPPV